MRSAVDEGMMKPEDRAIVIFLAVVVGVASAGGLYFILVAGNLPTTLPIPAGTTFTLNQTESWVAHFTAGPLGGRLEGAWTAYTGSGFITLVVVNGTASKPWPPPLVTCPLFYSWGQFNGSIDVVVGPGAHTIYWSTGYCSSAQEIVVTQSIQIIGP